jgi:iron(III) transport system substrate-binding protein
LNIRPTGRAHQDLNRLWRLTALAFIILFPARILATPGEIVVAYVAQDQVYAEPIFADFRKETGIEVKAVFDSEAVKTVGMANKLLAERSHPVCDVFWGNEEMRTRQLAAQNVFRATNGWTAFGCRSRRIVINTKLVSQGSAPRSLLDLTNSIWRGKVAVAYPLFGTTSAHFQALRQKWGESLWAAWCRGLAANKPFLVDGNSVVVKLVGRGEAQVGLTDSDDIAAGREEGMPVVEQPLTPDMLLIPNTVGVVRGGPHPEAAQKLFEYLQRPTITQRLVNATALEELSVDAVMEPTLKVNWDKLLEDFEPATAQLKSVFLR